MHSYLAFGIPILSDIVLPAFYQISDTSDIGESNPVHIKLGKVPQMLKEPALETKPFSIFNEKEFLYHIPNVARYYVSNGSEIIIEAGREDYNEVLLYLYSNCMAAILFQRSLIPFHVSGIFINTDKVLLFAAPSRTGKSTTAVMLQQKGYAPFTDDTATLKMEEDKCLAQASYPMIRLWQNSINNQTVVRMDDKHILRNDVQLNKYGFLFHDQFVHGKVEVAGLVFLEAEGSGIVTERIKPGLAMQNLGNNIYRKQWIKGMNKQILQFQLLTAIAHNVPAWKATRPKHDASYERFADAIESGIIHEILKSEVA